MITKHRLGLFVLLAALAVGGMAGDAAAQCCGTPSYGVAYQTNSPVTYTAYQPVSSWYPGCCLTRWWGGWWGGYRAAYAPTYTASYRPAYYTNYATSYATSYAPVSSYSSCTTCYAPSCTTCCDPCTSCPTACTSCYNGSGCTACGVTQASAMESYPVDTSRSQAQPQLAPGEDPPRERSTYETDKPATDNGTFEIRPEPSGDASDDSASFFEAPRLFNPKDQTALRHEAAPVRTAVYRVPAAGQPSKMRTISVSRHDAQLDAAGWTSLAE